MADEPQNYLGSIIQLTADIVSAYVSKNALPVLLLPELIANVNSSLARIEQSSEPAKPDLIPAINPKRSVNPDYIVCLEDGKNLSRSNDT